MIALVHGYGLSGSGSNLWTREVARALVGDGHTFHLVCQEPQPDAYPFIAEAYRYEPDGTVRTVLERSTQGPGHCTLHRPALDLLPTYVRPSSHTSGMRSILDCSDDEIDTYLARNVAALHEIVERYDVTALFVNHVILMAQAVERVARERGLPYGVMPHGSAIEYVVKHRPAMHALAEGTLRRCDHLFALNREIRQRMLDVFPDLPDLSDRTTSLPVGVDAARFDVVPRAERQRALDRLLSAIADQPRGHTHEHTRRLTSGLDAGSHRDETLRHLSATADYPGRRPDADLEDRLQAIPWAEAEVLVFVGRLIGHKGLPALMVALPKLLDARPNLHVLLAGAGPLREVIAAYLWALRHGHLTFARKLLDWAPALDDGHEPPYASARAYLDARAKEGTLEAYGKTAARVMAEDRVHFTGYLDHEALAPLYALADVGVFPSVVAEASPMVVPEAMAAGCLPVGADHAGMADSLDVAAEALPPEVAAHIRLRPDAVHLVPDLLHHVPAALDAAPEHGPALRRVAVERFDWHAIGRTLAETLHPARDASTAS